MTQAEATAVRSPSRVAAKLLAIAKDPASWAVALCAAIFAVTLYPGVGGVVNHGDSAKFQFLGTIAGISHPPGNPLYMWCDVAVSALPLPWAASTVVSALSALFGVVALVNVGRIAKLLVAGWLPAVVAILAVGLGPLFWTLATEAEVYTLHACIVTTAVWLGCRYALGHGDRWLAWAGFAAAIGFSNHLTIATLAPALAWLTWHQLRHSGARAAGRTLLGVALGMGVVVLLYLYVPLRAHAAAPYSELQDGVSARSLWAYATAREFHRSFGVPSVEVLVSERFPAILDGLRRQWLWPVWMAVPWGLSAIARRSSRAAAFLGVAIAGQLVFPLMYEIDDPAGFYVPIVVLMGVAIGAAVAVPARALGRLAATALVVLALAPLVTMHWREARTAPPFDRFEDLDDLRWTAWDLPDAVERMPDHARLLAPCGHYGCAQVLNYYRFTDGRFRDKHLEIAHLPGRPAGWHAPWPEIDRAQAATAPICAIAPTDVRSLRGWGLSVAPIERGVMEWGGKSYARPALWCTAPPVR